MSAATHWLTDSWSHADWARAYADLGWRLCGIAPRSKRPMGAGWQVATLEPEAWEDSPRMGMGLVHEGSGTCSLDVDDEEETRGYLARIGVDYDEMLAGGCRIDSGKPNRAKLLYRLPDGVSWTRHQIQTADKRAMLDLRCGRVQDVLPPSIHPDTGSPYRWAGRHPADLQPLPPLICELWERQESRSKPTAKATAAPTRVLIGVGRGASVIERFNDSASIAAILERGGYVPVGARWVAPSSSTGDPGVVLLTGDDGRQRVYSHHGSDVLGDGYAHDAFSVWCQLEHGGDVQAAVRQAASDLEIEEMPPALRAELDAVLDAEPEEEREEQVAEPAAPEELGPIPVESCEAVRGWLHGQHHAPKVTATMQAALSMICHTAARRYCLPSGQSLAVWLGVTDTSAAGHDALFGAVREAVAEHLQDLPSLRGTTLSSATPLYRHLLRTPRFLWATDELGHMVAMTRRQQSGAYETALAVLTSCYDGRTLYVDPDTATAGPTKTRSDSERRIYHPAASVLAFVAHDQIGALASRSEYGRGILQRLCVIDAGPSGQASEACEWPDSVRQVAEQIASGGLEAPVESPHAPPDLIVVAWSPHATAAWAAWQRATLAAVVADDTTRAYRGLVRGYAQTAMRIASALAAWDDPFDPVVTPGLARWACEWVGRCLASVLPVIATASASDGQPDPGQDAERAILRAGPRGCTSRELARSCRAFRRLADGQRMELLQRLASDGLIVERTARRKVLMIHHTFAKVAS